MFSNQTNISQTMRKTANIVLRYVFNMYDNITHDVIVMLSFAIRPSESKIENFTILVYPKSSPSAPHFDGIIPITVGAKC